MATNDDRFIPSVKPATRQPERKPSEPVPAVIPSLESINEELRRLWEYVYYLEGRSGPPTIRDAEKFLDPADGTRSITISSGSPEGSTFVGAIPINPPADAISYTDSGLIFNPRTETLASKAFVAAGQGATANNLTSGLVSEVGGALVTLGINIPQVGVRDPAYVGGVARLDTRSDHHDFSIRAFTVGSYGAVLRFSVDLNTGSVVLSGAALATTATDGFTYVPSCAGAPTGVPTTQTGTIPVVFDTTNLKLWAYTGGAWHFTLFT